MIVHASGQLTEAVMIKIAAYLLVGVGMGLAFAFWQGSRGEPIGAWDTDLSVADRGPIEKRLGELETALALERYEREVLAEELVALRQSMVAAPVSADDSEDGDSRERRVAVLGGDEEGERAQRLRDRFANGFPERAAVDENFFEQRQLQRLVEAGLPMDRAQWILRREEELQMEVLQARYEATQSGASPEEVASLDQSALLRAELGDSDYEKYLEGLGRPTTINVREVLTNSPAQTAGLQAGDEIVAYNGKRVFDMRELTELTYEARPGQSVAVDVVRDGQPIQVYVAAGPIGVSGGGRQRGGSRR
jgi:membrane-associated protease RseP (regulator of RpoE activity)